MHMDMCMHMYMRMCMHMHTHVMHTCTCACACARTCAHADAHAKSSQVKSSCVKSNGGWHMAVVRRPVKSCQVKTAWLLRMRRLGLL